MCTRRLISSTTDRRPDLRNQLVLADHRACMLDQHLQDIQGAPAQAQRPITFQDQSLTEVERVGAEVQHRCRCLNL